MSHQAGRPRSGRGVEVERGAGVVARRNHLHRRDVQECGEEDLRQGRLARRPFGPFQLQPGKATPGMPSIYMRADKIDEKALKALIRAAVALNRSVRPGAGPSPWAPTPSCVLT